MVTSSAWLADYQMDLKGGNITLIEVWIHSHERILQTLKEAMWSIDILLYRSNQTLPIV